MGSGPSKMSKASLAPSCDFINMHVLMECDDVGIYKLMSLMKVLPDISKRFGTSTNNN